MSQLNEAESRLSIHEVPEKISRIFFGDPKPSYNSPSSGGGYNYDSSYGYTGGNNYGGGNYNANYYYPGFPSDLQLLAKLGQVALIVFIVLAIVLILAMLLLACLYCTGAFRSAGGVQDDQQGVQGVQSEDGFGGIRLRHTKRQGFDKQGGLTDSDLDKIPWSPATPTATPTSHAHRQPRPKMTRHPGREHLDHRDSSLATPSPAHSEVDSASTSFEDPIDMDEAETLPKRRPSGTGPRKFFFNSGDSASAATSPPSRADTAETVVPNNKRRFPPVPPATTPAHQDSRNHPPVPRQISQQSDSNDSRSLPRSVPYYEVPAPTAALPQQDSRARDMFPPPPLPALPPPQRQDEPRSRKPFSYTAGGEFSTTPTTPAPTTPRPTTSTLTSGRSRLV